MKKINQEFEAEREFESERNGEMGLEQPVVVPRPAKDSFKTSEASEATETSDAPEISDVEMEEEMIDLYQTIESLLPDSEKKAIQFIGSKEGEGTSTIVRQFAKVASGKFGKSVLLLDTDMQKTSQFLFFDIKSGYSLEESFRDGVPLEKALCQIAESRLFVVRTFAQPVTSAALQASDPLNRGDFWENLKQRFDFILVDSLPASVSTNGMAFPRKVDGVVLVLEAEKTRWQVVESVKDKILKSGGKILGIVFNKRRYYIPKFIYKGL
ncbi:MAG: hypothetical protein NPINA01_14570 [Nitrospinaceae bacterium]|nr:MAG: hypothetical protein NPINA01_14570 [Nitrospinaceae bacterium]